MGYMKPLVLRTEDRHHSSMVLLHVQNEALLYNVQDVDPLEALKDPASSWPLGRLLLLIGI